MSMEEGKLAREDANEDVVAAETQEDEEEVLETAATEATGELLPLALGESVLRRL